MHFRHLLRNKDDLFLFATFGISEHRLSVVNISGGDFQDLAYSHATTGHEFKHEPVSWIFGSQDDLINNLFFQNFTVVRYFFGTHNTPPVSLG